MGSCWGERAVCSRGWLPQQEVTELLQAKRSEDLLERNVVWDIEAVYEPPPPKKRTEDLLVRNKDRKGLVSKR
jgi:hypothetical protein